jgi:hypothetical protein
MGILEGCCHAMHIVGYTQGIEISAASNSEVNRRTYFGELLFTKCIPGDSGSNACLRDTDFFFISCKFTIYSTNGAISKYVIRKHLCGATIQ